VVECGPCSVFASFILAFALQLRIKHGKTSVRVRKTSVRVRKTSVRFRKTSVTVQYTYYQKHPHITKPSQTHTLQNPLIHSYTHYKTIYNTWKIFRVYQCVVFPLKTRTEKRENTAVTNLQNASQLAYIKYFSFDDLLIYSAL
jgi:hypothetical protein